MGGEGVKLENLVACALLKEIHHARDVDGEELELHYIGNKDGHEIDFLITRGKQPESMIEVKWKDGSLSPNFKKFLADVSFQKSR